MRSILLALAVVLAALGHVSLDDDGGLSTWRRLHHEVDEAQLRIGALTAGNAALYDEVAALRSDPRAQERAVREELRWVRPGEVLVRVPRSERRPQIAWPSEPADPPLP